MPRLRALPGPYALHQACPGATSSQCVQTAADAKETHPRGWARSHALQLGSPAALGYSWKACSRRAGMPRLRARTTGNSSESRNRMYLYARLFWNKQCW